MIERIKRFWRTMPLRWRRHQLRRSGVPADQLGIMSALNEMIDNEMKR